MSSAESAESSDPGGAQAEDARGAAPQPRAETDGPARFCSFSKEVLDGVVQRIEIARRRQHACALADRMEAMLATRGLPGMAFDEHRSAPEEQVVVVPALAEDLPLWFVGDLHGDLLALECALNHIGAFDSSRAPTIVFLGDLFDDGSDGFEVVLRVFELLVSDARRICILAGNHDEALARSDSTFTSSVSPAEFSEWLNANQNDPAAGRIGDLVIRLFSLVPRALFLPDGLLVAHGGIPHRDLWTALTNREALNQPQCLADFVWTRAHERARSRVPNRNSRGCEFGYEDFAAFCQVAAQALGRPVERMVRGHDHVEDRYAVYERYQNKMLTINCLSRRLAREFAGPYERTPCVARWISGRLPEVHRLAIPADVIRQVYPEPAAVAEPTSDGLPLA